MRGDRDEIVLVELMHVVAAAHRQSVRAIEGFAFQRHAELGEPGGEPTTT